MTDAQHTQPGAPRAGDARQATLSPWSLILAGGIILALLLGQWTIVVAILGLAFLITVHEFGHFLAAKAFGMRVEKFYVGFPPAAARRTWGETEYGIGIIPLGGFCKISGMTPDEPLPETIVQTIVADAQDGALAGTYTLAEVDAARDELKTKVDESLAEGAADDTAAVAEWRRLQAVLDEYRAALLLPGGRGDPVYFRKPVWQRNITIAAGPFMNLLAAVVILVLYVAIQGVPVGPSMVVGLVEKGTPAAAIGLKNGDVIVGANGATWSTWAQAQQFFRAHPDQRISLTYRPAGAPQGAAGRRTVDVTLTHKSGQPRTGLLGMAPGSTFVRPGPLRAIRLGIWGDPNSNAVGVKNVVTGTFTGFWWLVSGKINPAGPDGAAGPVGIVSVSRTAVQQHWYPILLAFLSVNLGIINLLPMLPFDGGHIAINLLEKVRRRRLDRQVLERIVAFGTVLLVMLFIFLTFNDIRRVFGG
jgi:regulator of sigma E protease